MRVVVAPDKFAGTLSAVEAAAAIGEGWRRRVPDAEIDSVPMSDGGPGFTEVLHAALGGELVAVTVSDPYGTPVPATVLLVDGTAYLETAQGAGLHLTPAAAEPFGDGIAKAAANLANYDMGALVTGPVLVYDVAANWKVVAENYNECYHCGPVHPELTRLVPAFGGGGLGLEWEDGIPHREGAWTFTMTGTTQRAPLPGLDEHERTRHKGDLAYPNLMLSASADHVVAFVLHPRGVDRTEVVCSLLFAPEAVADASFDPSDAAELWHLVNQQDWAICESVQRGMSSRSYTHGWFAPMEDDSADIRRWLLSRLADG